MYDLWKMQERWKTWVYYSSTKVIWKSREYFKICWGWGRDYSSVAGAGIKIYKAAEGAR